MPHKDGNTRACVRVLSCGEDGVRPGGGDCWKVLICGGEDTENVEQGQQEVGDKRRESGVSRWIGDPTLIMVLKMIHFPWQKIRI